MAARIRRSDGDERAPISGSNWLSREDLGRSWKPWLRGTALGFPFGAMPTGGAEIPTFLSYATERRLARGEAREEFGKDAIEGVAGPAAANNAAFTGVLRDRDAGARAAGPRRADRALPARQPAAGFAEED